MNVVGSRPDGWWKDRRGALGRLVERLEGWASEAGERIVVVLEQPPSPPIASDKVEVAWAPSAGTNAADAEIVRRLPQRLAEETEVTVVTSDRELADRARSLGATVEGASTFRNRIDKAS